jgi:glycosyltransferase involved in cell wall biosynthesis
VPLLATACGGAKEVVEGVGILFPLGDAEHLAKGCNIWRRWTNSSDGVPS